MSVAPERSRQKWITYSAQASVILGPRKSTTEPAIREKNANILYRMVLALLLVVINLPTATECWEDVEHPDCKQMNAFNDKAVYNRRSVVWQDYTTKQMVTSRRGVINNLFQGSSLLVVAFKMVGGVSESFSVSSWMTVRSLRSPLAPGVSRIAVMLHRTCVTWSSHKAMHESFRWILISSSQNRWLGEYVVKSGIGRRAFYTQKHPEGKFGQWNRRPSSSLHD